MTNEEYKAAVGAIPHPPFSREWDAEVAKLSAALTSTFAAETKASTRVEVNADGEEVILASAQERICRDCGIQFTIPKRRGRPPACCPKCRGIEEESEEVPG